MVCAVHVPLVTVIPVMLKLVRRPVFPVTFLFNENGTMVVAEPGYAQPTYWRSDWFAPDAATWVEFVMSGLRRKLTGLFRKPAAVPGAFTSFGLVGLPVTAVTVMVVPLMTMGMTWPF